MSRIDQLGAQIERVAGTPVQYEIASCFLDGEWRARVTIIFGTPPHVRRYGATGAGETHTHALTAGLSSILDYLRRRT